MKRSVAMFGGPFHGNVVKIDPIAQRSLEWPWGEFAYVYVVREFEMPVSYTHLTLPTIYSV